MATRTYGEEIWRVFTLLMDKYELTYPKVVSKAREIVSNVHVLLVGIENFLLPYYNKESDTFMPPSDEVLKARVKQELFRTGLELEESEYIPTPEDKVFIQNKLRYMCKLCTKMPKK
jgi:hypothetical protein